MQTRITPTALNSHVTNIRAITVHIGTKKPIPLNIRLTKYRAFCSEFKLSLILSLSQSEINPELT